MPPRVTSFGSGNRYNDVVYEELDDLDLSPFRSLAVLRFPVHWVPQARTGRGGRVADAEREAMWQQEVAETCHSSHSQRMYCKGIEGLIYSIQPVYSKAGGRPRYIASRS